jgi:hypothetical protein
MASRKHYRKTLNITLSIFLIPLFLSSCGGGGSNVVSSSASVVPYNYTQGSKSSLLAAQNNIMLGSSNSLQYKAPNGTTYSSLTLAHSSLNSTDYPIASNDTNASTAWANGWTGLGVKVGIADSFNSNGVVDSHGDWVTVVVGSVAPEVTYGLSNTLAANSMSQLIYNVSQSYNTFESGGYHIVNNSWGIERAKRDSAGAYTGSLHADYDASVNSAIQATVTSIEGGTSGYDSDMLFIYASGNSGQYCGSTRLENCNYFASIVDGLRNLGYAGGSRLMWVGSLSDGTNTIAPYSIQAGNLKNDFIVAHDDILTLGDAAGTSFAAPRVSATAALLRHKFPNLNGSQIKQVLLQTATDIGASGVDDIYGYGKLNVMNAMSPQGVVVPK